MKEGGWIDRLWTLVQKGCSVLTTACGTVTNHTQLCRCCCDVAASGSTTCWAVMQRVKESGNYEKHCQTASAASLPLLSQNEELTFLYLFPFLFSRVLSVTWRKSVIVVGEAFIISFAALCSSWVVLNNVASLQLLFHSYISFLVFASLP